MEVVDCTKIVINRIQKLEPENAMKLIGYLLLKHTDKEIMEFAFGPDSQILSLINEAKAYLTSPRKFNIPSPKQSLLDQQVPYVSSSPTNSQPFSSPSSFRVAAPLWDPQMSLPQNLELPLPSYTDLIGGPKQTELLGLEDQLNHLHLLDLDHYRNNCSETALAGGYVSRSHTRLNPEWLEPPKACHYYNKGYCKNGIKCRFFHGQSTPDGFSNIHNPNLDEFGNEDQAITPGSLARLEFEIIELLKSKRGTPVSIASLPTLYLEKYGKVLQADGYLAESQRHGKAGFSLTRLLNRLNNSIRLVDRPHGQHAVILAEDSPKFLEYRGERIDQGAGIASSHQIYLTFPAESTFSEEDVFNYFNQYGPVHDVRIPRQERRMFGFVSFVYSETVKVILAKGHPHYICGARVLVKPYKEKSKLAEKKYEDKMEHHLPSQCFAKDRNPNSMLNMSECTDYLQRRYSEDNDTATELERRHLFELQLNPKQSTPKSYFSYGTEEFSVLENDVRNRSAVLSGTRSDFIPNQTTNNLSDRNSDHIELPDSPFSSPRVAHNISTVI
ncbi:zinc finger CCCH domain-containing protein 18 isoform X2 [Canna indica]|uniref:Zinc finger CCCH domain-containing protein 18 isoform X2 n=1 Tax=Canna indica TaxID=4628 RepID=A0AAQ3JNK8_9LILI|nr:zinc finger CCCH domain-containing protein 18 isoform X2 [Canna indica]